MIFDGHDLSTAFIVGTPQITPLSSTLTTQTVPGRDGAAFIGRDWAASTVTATLTVFGPPIYRRDAISKLGQWLTVDSPRKLVLPDSPDRYYMAVPSGEIQSERHVDAERLTVTFSVLEPAYGSERQVQIPSGGTVDIVVGGTYKTAPRITSTATGSSGVWGLRLDDGDVLKIPVTSGFVDVDCGARTSKVAGVVALPTLDSDWLVLEPGPHKIQQFIGSGAATLTFVERWL